MRAQLIRLEMDSRNESDLSGGELDVVEAPGRDVHGVSFAGPPRSARSTPLSSGDNGSPSTRTTGDIDIKKIQ